MESKSTLPLYHLELEELEFVYQNFVRIFFLLALLRCAVDPYNANLKDYKGIISVARLDII